MMSGICKSTYQHIKSYDSFITMLAGICKSTNQHICKSKAMKTVLTIILAAILMGSFTSCKSVDSFDNRKYTDGQYRDLNLFREKSDKSETLAPATPVEADSCKSRLNIAIDQMKDQFTGQYDLSSASSSELLHDNYPVIAARFDSTLVRQAKRDTSSWMNDTLPDAIGTALSTQAMVGLGTVGGLITIAAPEAIWFFFFPMVFAPICLVISLIAAAVAMSKIQRGEIDGRYRKWMKLWAVCLLINLVLGSLVLMHFVFL